VKALAHLIGLQYLEAEATIERRVPRDVWEGRERDDSKTTLARRGDAGFHQGAANTASLPLTLDRQFPHMEIAALRRAANEADASTRGVDRAPAPAVGNDLAIEINRQIIDASELGEMRDGVEQHSGAVFDLTECHCIVRRCASDRRGVFHVLSSGGD